MTVRFLIDGVQVEAEKGDSLLDTARRAGFHIPSLCHHKAVVPYGACRLCLVEVTHGGRKTMTTSCNYPVQEGIAVNTDSQDIRRHRAMVLELILAEAKESETIKSLATEYGVVGSRFPPLKGALQRRDECILCGLCARVCSEVIGASALSFSGRGDKRNMGGPFMEKPESCVGCGACVSHCPTGCIQMEERDGVRTVWGCAFELVPCDTCGAPLMTVEHRDLAVRDGDLDGDYFTTCARCKKKLLAGRFSSIGLRVGEQ